MELPAVLTELAKQVADGVDLVGHARHGRNHHAVGIDPGVDEQLGELDGRALDGHGHAQLDEGDDHVAVDGEPAQPEVEAKQRPLPIQVGDGQQKAESLTDDRGQRRARRRPGSTRR